MSRIKDIVVDGMHPSRLAVMLDPEGNEFCVTEATPYA